MIDKYKTKKQLISELDDIRQRVSELKTLGADRWTTEEMLSLFLTAVPNSIVLVDQEGKIIFVNSRAESMLGYGQNELIGQQVDILMPLRFRIKHADHIKDYYTDPQMRPMGTGRDLFAVRKDGSEFPVEISLSPIPTDNGLLVLSDLVDITERKRAEETLISSQQNYEALINTIDGIVWEADAQTFQFTFVSKQAERLLGYPVEHWYTDPSFWKDHLHPEDREWVYNLCLEGALEKRDQVLEYRMIAADGRVVWLKDIVSVIIQDDNNVKLRGIMVDITENKLAEDKLKLTQFAVDHGGDSAVWVTQNGQYTYVNDAACQSTGYSQQELLSMTVFDIDLDITKEIFDNLWKELKNIKTATFESRHRSKDGSIFPVEITANMHKYAGEEHVFAFARNITERKRAEETLRESEERYRTIVENTNDLISETDVRGRITYASPNHFEILGYGPEEMLGKGVFTLVHPDDLSSVKEEFYKGVKNFSSGHAVYRILQKSGDWLLFESSGKPFITATGNIHVVIQSRDITDKKRMEEELLKSQKLESVGILAGGIAHDFNNILTSIMGNISLIKIQTEPEDKIYDMVTEAEKACFRARDLTQQFLTFSKGGAPIKKLTSIGGLLEDVAGFMLRGSNVKCELTIPDNLWTVEVDESQISQVIENLIINADQAMPAGGIVWLEAENVVLKEADMIPEMEGKAVKITVKDKGIGIAEDNMLKIFDPYYSTKKDGSGLGLAMVYSIVTKHGGSVQVKSELGEGTTFFVYIPATDIEVQKAEVILDVIETGKGNILFMDDEALVRKAAGDMLLFLGYSVQYASDGEETIEKYKKSLETGKPYDLVVVDLTIPGGMGGLETMEKLLEIDPKVSALVSSGYWKDSVMGDIEKYGFKGVIAKPYNIEELGRLLHELIGT